MKKATPLQGIPQVPKTVAGQWLAFSHMANHYRRLLNVKPRVDTSAPKTGSTHCIPSKASITNVNRGNKRGVATSKNQKGKESSKSDRKKQQELNDKYSHSNINLRKPSSKSSHHIQNALDSEYQLVFGPTSLKSSVDALVSDCESCEEQSPRVKPMGIAEKIRMFLDNAQDSMGAPSASTRKMKKPSETQCNSKDSRLRIERHSKCFEPLDINRESPKKYKASPNLSRKSGSLKTLYHHRNGKDEGPKRDSTNAGMSKRNLTVQQIIDSSLRRAKKPVRNRQISGGGSDQSASVGTIRGSDDLTEEIDLPPMATATHSKQFIGIDTKPQKLVNDWATEKRNKKSAGSNSAVGINSYLHHGKSTSMSSLALGLVNNKDSSRDSAYGFSSGESRITTRESTPEKTANNKKSSSKRKSAAEVNGKYKSSLSTVASSVNQETSPVNSSRFSNEGRHGFAASATDMGHRRLNEERYVGFLTEVTDDIVNRGIYTNKGLKSLFNSHLEKNVHLDRERMLQMLDRLRIDVGIPKEDSLNQLEFGYGSVKYSSGPYFTSTGSGSNVYNHNSKRNDIHQEISSNSSVYSNNIQCTNKSNNKRISNALIDDGKGSSYSASGNSQDSSEHNIPDGNDDGSNFEVSSQSSKSSFSISENEMNSTLRKIGFDSFTAMEIVGIAASDSKIRISKDRNEVALRNSKSNREYRSTNNKILSVNDNSAANTYNKSRENLLHRSRSQQSLGSY